MKRTPLKRKTPLRRRSLKRLPAPVVAKWDAYTGGRESPIGDVPHLPRGIVSTARGPVVVSTVKREAAPQVKAGDLVSSTLRAFVREHAACRFEVCKASELHHVPTRGALGFTCDALAIPVCRAHHDACHNGGISLADQYQEVALWWRWLVTNRPDIARAAMLELATSEGA